MGDEDKLNSLLHYMKGVEPFSAIFRESVRGSKTWCPFTHSGTDLNVDCYSANPSIQAMLEWGRKYVQVTKFADSNRYTVDDLSDVMARLASPERMKNYEDFRELLTEIKSHVAFIESSLHEKLNRLSCYECSRLDEALVAFSNYCFTASVAMAVSAVENRLIELIRKKNKTLYTKEFQGFTLGRLIQVFDENQYKAKKYASIKKLLPTKHKPLLLLLNQYRIFSVHPIGEPVSPQIAEAIVHLSFAFMLDEQTCPYTSAELECV